MHQVISHFIKKENVSNGIGVSCSSNCLVYAYGQGMAADKTHLAEALKVGHIIRHLESGLYYEPQHEISHGSTVDE